MTIPGSSASTAVRSATAPCGSTRKREVPRSSRASRRRWSLGSRRPPTTGVRRRGSRQVAEGREPLARLRVHRARRGRPPRRHGRLQRPPQRVHDVAVFPGHVAALGGIGLEVVQLRARGVDQLPPPRAPRVERRPSEMQEGRERLDVGRLLRPAARRRAAQRPPVRAGQRLEAREVEERRGHVYEARERARDGPPRQTGTGGDERHAHRGVVDEYAVRLLAVLAEALAVVGRDQDDRARR